MTVDARLTRNRERLDDMSVRAYIVGVAGRRVYEVVWEPLLRGKFGPYADSVSAAWLWWKLVDRGGSRDSRGHELLGYLRGGLGRVLDRIIEGLLARGHHVHLGSGAIALEGDGRRISRIVTDEGAFDIDAAVAAAQTPDVAKLLPPGQTIIG